MADVNSGGPYLLEVKTVGFKFYRIADFFIKLDEGKLFNIIPHEVVNILKGLIVNIPSGNKIIKMESGTGQFSIEKSQIIMLPSIKRSMGILSGLAL